MQVQATLHTNGHGWWSDLATDVEITRLALPYNAEDEFGELRVYFNTRTWNVDDNGLIYTDKLFIKELKEFLTSKGFDATDVGYSEQGMQGDDYVSLDVGAKFIASWNTKEIVLA